MHMTMLKANIQYSASVTREVFKLSVCEEFKSHKLLETSRAQQPFSRAFLLLHVKVSAVTAETPVLPHHTFSKLLTMANANASPHYSLWIY